MQSLNNLFGPAVIPGLAVSFLPVGIALLTRTLLVGEFALGEKRSDTDRHNRLLLADSCLSRRAAIGRKPPTKEITSPHQPTKRLASNLFHIAQYPPCILSGRKSKHPRIIPAELRCALVAHFEGSRHDAFGIHHHQGSGLEQAHPLLVLQEAQVGLKCR